MTPSFRTRLLATLASLALIALIAWVDGSTAYELSFGAFYLIPVGLVTWYEGRTQGSLMALLSVGGVAYAAQATGHVYPRPFYFYWALLNEWLALMALVLVVGWLRETLRAEQAARESLAKALREVQQLEGMLPVCSWCRKIRDDSGAWEDLETYVGHHSKATFTHGLCPDCRTRVFPESLPS